MRMPSVTLSLWQYDARTTKMTRWATHRWELVTMRIRRIAIVVVAALWACCLGLAACDGRPEPEPGGVISDDRSSPFVTPSSYVFESMTVDGDTITDPNELFLDRSGETEPWYYLTIAFHDGRSGRLCTDGRIADFSYEMDGDTITLDVPLDFGFDGARLELGEGTLTMKDDAGTTVLRLVGEVPALVAD